MFNMTCTKECELKGTITFARFPGSLGCHTDVNGKRWDIQGIFGNTQTVWACPYSALHPYYTSTATNCYWGVVNQEWHPYKIEVQNA